jgi:hypothetical protein
MHPKNISAILLKAVKVIKMEAQEIVIVKKSRGKHYH